MMAMRTYTETAIHIWVFTGVVWGRVLQSHKRGSLPQEAVCDCKTPYRFHAEGHARRVRTDAPGAYLHFLKGLILFACFDIERYNRELRCHAMDVPLTLLREAVRLK